MKASCCRFVFLVCWGIWAAAAAAGEGGAVRLGPGPPKIVGMYVHQHWPYNHPYAARTWTLDDWRGYAEGLRQLGYNTLLIWPMLETMPDPLTPSDQANIEKMAGVIEVLHNELGMRVFMGLCPNVGVNSQEAAKSTFTARHFFYCDTRVNPGDPAALKQLMERREKLLRPLAATDGITVIDSDPGGYPGSTNAEFVNLLAEHRKMLDRLRPGIGMYYWMHAGWEGYCRFYKTGRFSWGTPQEQIDALTRLKALNPEPWGIANGRPYAEKLGLADRVIIFNYGRIEGEPSFPLTNFGGDGAYTGGQGAGPRGVMGNAQTHCVQLPNTFAFARGATHKTLNDEDYVAFADDLVRGQGRLIVQAWKTLAGTDTRAMGELAGRLEALPESSLQPGPLKGLLFASPRRFVNDLAMQLRLKAAYAAFRSAAEHGQGVKEALGRFLAAAEAWQGRHGYKNAWSWPGLEEALRKLNSPVVNRVLESQLRLDAGPDPNAKETPFEQVQSVLRNTETYTPRLIAAMRTALEAMK